jgi:hypothetical protein
MGIRHLFGLLLPSRKLAHEGAKHMLGDTS